MSQTKKGEPNEPRKDIKCPCCEEKVIAKKENEKILVWCKKCKKEVELKTN